MAKQKKATTKRNLCWICGEHSSENEFGTCKNCQMCIGLAMFSSKYTLGAAAFIAGMKTYATTNGPHAVKSQAANAKLEEALTRPPSEVIV